MVAPLVTLAIKELPGIIRLVRELRAKQAPTDPPPSEAEIMAALNSAYESSKAKDAAWLAAHPE